MPHRLLDRDPDLSRLREEGYDVEIRYGHLLVKDVPYVNERRQVRRGVLTCELTLAGTEALGPMKDHTARFAGEYPCDSQGRQLTDVVNSAARVQLGESLVVDYYLSSKPLETGVYPSYFDKMTAYVRMLSGHAEAIDRTATALTGAVAPPVEDDSPFQYGDLASSRAGLHMVTQRLKLSQVALIGVGGTGAYVLDLVAKTPVREIHLFDGDGFYSHNAFRSPGAASLDQLNCKPRKTTYLLEVYSKMHKGIVEHPYFVDSSNVHELQGMDFVFLCMDSGDAKRVVVQALERFGTPFIDVGMGVQVVDDSLRGTVRLTTSTPTMRGHLRTRVSLSAPGPEDEYDSNIQIADLNSLNAALAVIRWKKHFGFYLDFEREHHTTYSISTNALVSDDPS